MWRKVLLIEDDKKKIDDITEYLGSNYDFSTLVVKESYQSGMRAAMEGDFDLLLLDMSIPTWDKSPTETGGSYQKFGGYKILKEVIRKEKKIKTILITMFDDFGESDTSITLKELNDLLKKDFPEVYQGAIFYSTRETKWKDELDSYLKKKE